MVNASDLMEKGYLKPKEAAQYLNMSLRSFMRWRQRRGVPACYPNGKSERKCIVLFRRADLDQEMERCLQTAAHPIEATWEIGV